MAKSKIRIENKRGKWNWLLVNFKGEPVAQGATSYDLPGDAKKRAQSLWSNRRPRRSRRKRQPDANPLAPTRNTGLRGNSSVGGSET